MRKLSLFILLITLSCINSLAHDFEVDGIYYNIINKAKRTIEVSYRGEWSNDYKGDYTGDVTIPSSVRYRGITYSVTKIGNEAFSFCHILTSITIPNSVTEIGDMAFWNCGSLTSITIPNSVTLIGKGAFGSCYDLTSIVVEERNKNYDSRNNCNAIIETSTNTLIAGCMNTIIPYSVTKIGEEAFSGCHNLKSISIPNQVTEIGKWAFGRCRNLKSISIPNQVTEIGEEAFFGCSGLESIVVEEGNRYYDSRDNCNAIIETSTNTLIAGCMNTIIPNSVTKIGKGVFREHSNLTSITIPNSVTEIGEAAFLHCRILTSIIVEDGNKNYDSRNNCNAIIETSTNTLIAGCKSSIIPYSVTKIGEMAFGVCENLTSITIPNSVTEIGEKAFRWYNSLEYAIVTNPKTHYYDNSFPSHTKIIRPKQELKSERDSYKWQYISYGDDKCGANAADGKEIVPAKYSEVEYIPNYEGYFLVRKNGCYAIYNPSGKIIIPISRNYSSIVKTRSDGRYYYRVCKSGKYGVCNIDGYEIVAPLYDNIIFSDGIFLYKDASGTWISLNKGLDRNNAVVENPTYTKRDVAYYDLALQQGRLEDSFGKKVRVEQVTSEGKRAFKIVFEDKILFEFGEYDLNSSALNYIDKVTETLNELPSTKVRITGYTDNVGSLTSNRRLSTQRANAVSEYLQQKGISASRIIAKGIPLADYVATNKTEEGRALNRRVEIVIEPK